jgi:hypothetical protein
MNTVNYSTVRQTAFLKEKLFNVDKQIVELTNRLSASDAKLAEMRAVCDKVEAFCHMVAEMHASFFTPAERARLPSARNLKGLI